jgi:hypothetical protein
MDPWPLRHLVLRTPRLELRPDDDAGLLELAEEAERGVHAPDYMPFFVPWTDNKPREWLQYYWATRAALRPDDWTIQFLVRHNGRVIGEQGHGWACGIRDRGSAPRCGPRSRCSPSST